MPALVALLRGINLAKRRRVAMSDLRALLEEAGYADVRTHLQSGNVVLRTRQQPQTAARRIEQAIEAALGLDVDVLVRTAAEVAEVVAADPFAGVADNGSRYFVLFLDEPPPQAALDALAAEDFAPDAFAAGSREVYVWCPEGLQDSRLMKALGKELRLQGTVRNWNTVTRLAELSR